MQRIILVLAMLALLVVMALPALAQDGGLVIYDNGEWRGSDDPRDLSAGGTRTGRMQKNGGSTGAIGLTGDGSTSSGLGSVIISQVKL